MSKRWRVLRGPAGAWWVISPEGFGIALGVWCEAFYWADRLARADA